MNFDTLVLPPEYLQALQERIDEHVKATFMGMRVIQSPLARKTRQVPDRLRRSTTFPFRHFEIAHKEVSEPVAIMFNAPALGFLPERGPIFPRNDMGIVSIYNACLA